MIARYFRFLDRLDFKDCVLITVFGGWLLGSAALAYSELHHRYALWLLPLVILGAVASAVSPWSVIGRVLYRHLKRP
jgi:uncharacterized membrane protein